MALGARVMAQLFDTLQIRNVTFRNRIAVSPMCQYSAQDGFANDWHLVHLGSRAIGGAALVVVEATAVEARGRISPSDLGLWQDAQREPLARIARFLEEHGAVAGIQLAHAGRKASTACPWEGGKPLADEAGGWDVVGASPIPFDAPYRVPHQLSIDELAGIRAQFCAAAERAASAGFRYLELHAAHGYLLHSFLSPLSNQRTDAYGGSFENRTRFLLEITAELRKAWPEDRVLGVRLSCTDWAPGGWTVEDTVQVARLLEKAGVDLIDCSSGGNVLGAQIPLDPGYQVPFAEAVKRGTGLRAAAVGLITEPAQASAIIAEERADFVFLARELLRDPYFALHAAQALGHAPSVPPQYARAF